jgi:CBS domain containing-hemolysin-like protein
MSNSQNIIGKLLNFFLSLFSLKVITKDDYNASIELKKLLDDSKENNSLNPDDKNIVYSLLEFRDSIVREVMVPRIDMKCINNEASISTLRKSVKEFGHSRFPVFKEKIDNIIGIINIKDILFYDYENEPNLKITDLMREPYFIPETKKVNDLLSEFQNKNLHMAIVVDEYGGIAGLITIEDLLEEIVGEIKDEYDQEEDIQIQKLSDNSYVLDARYNIDDFEDYFKIKVPEGDFDTIAGLISHLSGTVPKVGDELTMSNIKFEILQADARKIGKIKVTMIEPHKEEKEELDNKS